MSQPIRGQGSHLGYMIGPKNKNLVEVVEICFLSSFVEFCSVVSMKKSKCLSHSEAGAAILIFRLARKHKLGRECADLASYQVSLNFIQWFQRRSQKWLSQSEDRMAILFSNRPEKHKLGRGH